MSEEVTKNRRKIGVFRIVIVVLVALVVALVLALALVIKDLQNDIEEAKPVPCPVKSAMIDLETPEVIPPFYDLTEQEIAAVREYLYSQPDLNLVKASNIRCNNSYIYTMELNVPNKELTLGYLDKGKPQPEREAIVLIFRGDAPETYVEEYIVGPLPYPIYKKNHKTYPFRYRPLNTPETIGALNFVSEEVHQQVGDILEESYGGKMFDCGDKCIAFTFITPVSPATSKQPITRKMWFWLTPVVEFPTIHPYDFRVLVDLTSNHIEEYTINKILYGGSSFDNFEKLKEAYSYGSVRKTKIPFPENIKEMYSSMHRRGTEFPKEPLMPPLEYEPSGKRYSIKGRHINYMLWDFDIRMSSMSGPQIFDIRFNKKRIAYELSLQEISVMYSGHDPSMRFADYVDSVALIGSRARALVAGADCPNHATFLSADHVMEYSEEPVRYDRAFCVFEHNTGIPLRRHLSATTPTNKFYEGMQDIVLTVRTIATVLNYDYIFDFTFHQNGAVEVKAMSTGFILTAYRFPPEDDYGFRLREHVTGNLHQHMFHFKADLDINGKANRFETLDIKPTDVDNSKWSTETNARYGQTKFIRNQVSTEKQAALKFDLNSPRYLTFYNKDFTSTQGVPRAYRLLVKGVSKQLFPEGRGQEPSVSWTRYQVAVTKYKENERRSSSVYAIWDADKPTVNFQSFIDDDEDILDEDLVTWVTMGVQHIPHMEDFPVTPTVGLQLEFFLLPYNYFDEDPAMGSGDAVRVEPRDQDNVGRGLHVYRYGRPENAQCLPSPESHDDSIQRNPEAVFDPMSGL